MYFFTIHKSIQGLSSKPNMIEDHIYCEIPDVTMLFHEIVTHSLL